MGTAVTIRAKVRLGLLAGCIPLIDLSPRMPYRYYSLEVVQHPIRARMCGFGDKVCRMNPFPAGCTHPQLHFSRIGDRWPRLLWSKWLSIERTIQSSTLSKSTRPAVRRVPYLRGATFSEVDCSFFLLTVDLWSQDGDNEMNLVLHPTSSDRYVPSSQPKVKRRATTSSATAPSQSSATQTPVPPTPTTMQYSQVRPLSPVVN